MLIFEKLEVWKDAIAFAGLVYTVTGKFPDAERFGLTSQMRRAAVSISSNIAEGSSRSSRDDFARYLEIATGSLFEVISQSALAKQQNLLTADDFRKIYEAGDKQVRMLSGLKRSLKEPRQ